MLFWALVILLSPIWVPIALAVLIAIMLAACAVIIIVSFALVALLVHFIRAFYNLQNWIIKLRTEVVAEAHDELRNISYYRLMTLYWKQAWKILKQPRMLP